MQKKKRRLIVITIFFIIPILVFTGYIVYSQYKEEISALSTLFKDLKKVGVKEELFSFSAGGDNDSAENDGAFRSAVHDGVPVTVFKAFITGFRDSLPVLGSLKGHKETRLSFEKAGMVKSFNFKEGDLIPAGVLISSLESEESEIKVRHAEAKVREAEVNLALADKKLNRITQKYKLGGTSKSLYEESMLEYEKTESMLDTAEIALENIVFEMKKCDLFSPHEGLLGNKYVDVGETVSPNTLLCDLIDVSFMVVAIGVVERDIEKVSKGQKVNILVDAYPSREFMGVVDVISPVVEGQSRTFSVDVRVANPQKLLLPGMFARVKINVFEKKNALVIPASAIVSFRNKSYVYVVSKETQVASERPVAVQYATADYAVISRGIKEGELVVIGEKQGVGDGIPVKIIEEQVPEM